MYFLLAPFRSARAYRRGQVFCGEDVFFEFEELRGLLKVMMSAQAQTKRMSAISACYTMPFAWSGATAALAARDGFDPARSLRKAGLLDGTTEINADSRLGPADFVLIALSLINAFDDELHGVAPQRMAKGTASMASRAMTSSTDLFGAIETMARFLEMVGAGCRIAQRRSADSAIIDIRADCENEQLRSILEEFFAHFVHQQLSYFLGHRLPLISFTTAALEHPAAGSQHPYLLSQVAHGRTTTLTFSAEYLKRSRRSINGDNPLSEALMLWLRQHPINGEVATACAGPSSLTSIVYSSFATAMLMFVNALARSLLRRSSWHGDCRVKRQRIGPCAVQRSSNARGHFYTPEYALTSSPTRSATPTAGVVDERSNLPVE